ncbi:CSLREA domain-containing protein [Nevskia sp.]|uniref:CSLREA domain-containing protein n=1 Tax=Nevskia sp. TaxID=1929292 RepID=UPI0025FFDA67|nr:CSLREA domain-containing protein [Nevskia sp.]
MNQNLVTAARHCAVGLLVTTMALPLQAALAADIVVSKFTDSLDGSCNSDCSLREAVQLANQTPGASRIILAAGTYRLSIAPEQGAPNPGDDLRPIDDDANLNGDLDIGGTLSVVGKGIDVTTIDAGGIDRIFEALPGAVVKLAKLTVRNGHHGSRSGGIDINVGASLALQSAAVTQNSAWNRGTYPGSYGGGISNYGTLTVDASRIDGNSVEDGDYGPIDGIQPGSGGGIFNRGSLTVRDAYFIDNDAYGANDNGAGGAIWNDGKADIRRASFEDNYVSFEGAGAAIFNFGAGQLRLENSTVAGHYRAEPYWHAAAVENGARQEAAPAAAAKLINVTIAGYSGYGLINRARLTIVNSIVAGNGNGTVGEPFDNQDANCLNEGTSARFSQTGLLRGTDSGNCPSTLLVLNADSFVTLMYPLALNNWQTPTFALRPGSIAVDSAVGSCPSTDQRRVSRPRDGNGDGIAACDLGAYERPKP